MKKATLGLTGIPVTRLGIGTLTMSPMQRSLSIDDGSRVILAALEGGIGFIDTAQMYGSYPQVAAALKAWKGPRPTVTTKSAAATKEAMTAAVEEARNRLRLDVIDGFLLHAVKNAEDFERRRPALDVLLEAKARGWIRAIGASSHAVGTIGFLVGQREIEILHPIVNKGGFGVLDATLEQMLHILADARRRGIGIYAMKPLGGGHLRHQAAEALAWILERPEVDAAVVGMTSRAEVEMNLAIADGKPVSDDLRSRVAGQPRRLFMNEALCQRCGKCLEVCDHHAIVKDGDKYRIDYSRCVTCGYCAPHCPGFALRII